MSTIACPCCRAANDVGPNCRRCKADLGLLFAVAERRAFLVSSAQRQVALGEFETALETLAEAESLQQGPDVGRVRAVAYLAAGHFRAAWNEYRAVNPEPARRL